MGNFKKENFTESTAGETCLKIVQQAAGSGATPTDPVTGKRLSRVQMEHAKNNEHDSVKVVVTS